ncbi:DedA family protein [Kutzneria viridogrisea]|uniref:Membrane-associated protein n=1 Tax=Kutzneria viridogrisea TaxID=47990 RepID=A0ABR6BRQ5_9PSEU|nr:DedA family protein [Kutzneria albida]MBA8929592.1 membrane-associated protein [Kutzneria viridogrisea]
MLQSQVMAIGSWESVGPAVLTVLVLVCIFVECGFLIGLLFPGDSLLFTAGVVFAQQHQVGQAWLFCGLAVLSGIAGGQAGYYFARKTGSKFVARRDGKVLNQHNLDRAQKLLDGWGFWAVTVARMIPWVRTVVPTIAGAAKMSPTKFLFASVLSTATWVAVFVLAGYFGTALFDQVPWLKTGLLVVAVTIVVVTTAVGVVRYRQDKKKPVEETSLVTGPGH